MSSVELENIKVLQGHTNTIQSLTFTQDSKILISSSSDQTIRFWNMLNDNAVKVIQAGHVVRSISLSPDGFKLAFATYKNEQGYRYALIDISTARITKACGITGLWGGKVVFNSVGNMLATVDTYSATILLRDATTSDEIRKLEGHKDTVWAVSFNYDGSILASGGIDRQIKLWDVVTGEVILSLKTKREVYSLAFSPDGKTLASGMEDGTIILWDIQTAKEITRLSPQAHGYGGMWEVIFHPDGKVLISNGSSAFVELWDVLQGKGIKALKVGERSEATAIALNKEGTLLATAIHTAVKEYTIGKDGESIAKFIDTPENEFTIKIWKLTVTEG